MLRSALFNVAFFAITFVLTLAATVVRLVAPKYVYKVAVFWARSLIFTMHVICGIRLHVSGLENIPPGAALIASRHQSAFDTFAWLTLVPHCCYVLKDDLLRIPLFGSLATAMRMIPVDRDGGGAAIRSLLREGDRAVREGRQIVIFPEGTRSEPGKPGELQSGVAAMAARTGLPVIPVSTNSGLYWGRRAFRKQPGTIRIAIGAPITDYGDRRSLMRALEAGMATLDLAETAEMSKSVDNSVKGSSS